MTRRIFSAILDAVTREWSDRTVHFHAHGGRPYPCYDARCTSPRYDADHD
jgi:hypothetical protein